MEQPRQRAAGRRPRRRGGRGLREGGRPWRRRALYDALHQAELTYYLATQPAAFDAVVSADTLCYFGPLETVFAAARQCLRPGGWLVFTVEALPDDARQPHRLQSNGRYAHHQAYLREALAAAGFVGAVLEHERLRME